MKFKKGSNLTYKGYLQDAWYSKDAVDEREVMELAKHLKNLSVIKSPAIPMLYIIDYVKRSYLLMSDGIKAAADYDPREFIESGLQKTLDIYHQDDFKVYNQKIFKKNLSILQNTPQAEHQNLLFTYNFRIRCRNKQIANFLQKGFYITDTKSGLPRYSLGAITDVTNVFLKENLIIHVVEKNKLKDNKHTHEILTKEYYFSGEENNQLTKQERVILHCLADGHSSKAIAEKLNISSNTVNNHRQNILSKTNTKNVAQLITYAVKNKLI